MSDPRELFQRAVPPSGEVDLGAVRRRAEALARRRRVGFVAGGAAAVLLVAGAAVALVETGQEALVPAVVPSSSAQPSAGPSPTPSTAASPSAGSGEQQTVQVYFTPTDKPEFRCDSVVPADRTVAMDDAPAGALRELFRGPTPDERNQGLAGSGTEGIVRSVRVANGAAYVDLDPALERLNNVSTTCAGTMLVSQMTSTLLQFTNIAEAYFAIDGDPDRFYGLLERVCPDRLRDGDTCDRTPFADPEQQDAAALIDRLQAFAESPTRAAWQDLPLAETVQLGVGDRIVKTVPREDLADAEGWNLDLDLYAGYVGPFNALELLRGTEPTKVTVGEHPHCASPPRPAPTTLAGLRRWSTQPRSSECLRWHTVDLYVDEQGTVQGVTLDLWEP